MNLGFKTPKLMPQKETTMNYFLKNQAIKKALQRRAFFIFLD